jgi:hypothetical protein
LRWSLLTPQAAKPVDSDCDSGRTILTELGGVESPFGDRPPRQATVLGNIRAHRTHGHQDTGGTTGRRDNTLPKARRGCCRKLPCGSTVGGHGC